MAVSARTNLESGLFGRHKTPLEVTTTPPPSITNEAQPREMSSSMTLPHIQRISSLEDSLKNSPAFGPESVPTGDDVLGRLLRALNSPESVDLTSLKASLPDLRLPISQHKAEGAGCSLPHSPTDSIMGHAEKTQPRVRVRTAVNKVLIRNPSVVYTLQPRWSARSNRVKFTKVPVTALDGPEGEVELPTAQLHFTSPWESLEQVAGHCVGVSREGPLAVSPTETIVPPPTTTTAGRRAVEFSERSMLPPTPQHTPLQRGRVIHTRSGRHCQSRNSAAEFSRPRTSPHPCQRPATVCITTSPDSAYAPRTSSSTFAWQDTPHADTPTFYSLRPSRVSTNYLEDLTDLPTRTSSLAYVPRSRSTSDMNQACAQEPAHPSSPTTLRSSTFPKWTTWTGCSPKSGNSPSHPDPSLSWSGKNFVTSESVKILCPKCQLAVDTEVVPSPKKFQRMLRPFLRRIATHESESNVEQGESGSQQSLHRCPECQHIIGIILPQD
ncbi:hypothetical protein IWQ62_002928 [Dispira parvispora]|uniref:Uncharacterized protein n=1 Tax=Dispira parvispora TaxID=1520584 RepID=A0A9W8E265_9FUNG|nr:hypothetical protein IWQ62_002928 [Dispira parvispora]